SPLRPPETQPVLLDAHRRWLLTKGRSMSSWGKGLIPFVIISVITWSGCVGLVSGVDQVTVATAGGGTGVVTSTPNGINCSGLGGGATSGTCQSTFRTSPTLTLAAAVGQVFTFGGCTVCKSASGTTCTVSR